MHSQPEASISIPAVSLRALRLVIGSCVANASVSLDVAPGSIHGILGENGAGKSTAMKILSGMLRADSGEIRIDGIPRDIREPADAKALGIGMVHQHFMLSEAQTVLENIVLGREPGLPQCLPQSLKLLDRDAAERRLQDLMQRYGLHVPLESPVSDLSVSMQQRVEILKLLYNDARILILDEPTAVLSPPEIERFFTQLKVLAREGRTILIVTHKLRELLAITDSISIFRAGTVIATVATQKSDADGLAALMIGKRIEPVRNSNPGRRSENPVVDIRGLELRMAAEAAAKAPGKPCDLTLYPGEILGLAGIEGNGQKELVAFLRNPRQKKGQGRIQVSGQDASSWPATRMVEAGLACIPADRHREGLLLDRSATKNFVLGYQDHPAFSFGPFIRWPQVRQATLKGMADCAVQPANPDLPMRHFSGGNQQKLIFARETYHKPKILIAVHPTRGVDVGAIQLIHRQLLELRAQGVAVLLVSSELDEILALADRIVVMENFEIRASFAADECDETALGLAMSGAMKETRHVP